MNFVKTTILLAGLAALLIFCGGALGGRQGAIIGLVFAGVMNFGTYWFSDKIVLKMYRAKQVSEEDQPDLYATVRVLAENAELPMPKVYIMNKDAPNAFATGRNPAHAAVAVTSGLMKLLSREELGGVIAHELSHIKNRDILISTVAATVAGAISYMAQMAMWASMFSGRSNRDRDGSPIVLIIMMIVGPLAAMIIQMAISRSREYGADKGGAEITGHPLYLASALKKLEFYNKKMPMPKVNDATAHMFIVSPLAGGGMRKLFSTHPPMAERVKRLEAMAKED
jgi:heat shock protein HtpX